MTPYEVGFAPEANAQLLALFDDLCERSASVAVAANYVEAVIDTCERLAQFPLRCPARDDIRPGLRLTHHRGKTVIAFAVDAKAHSVTILGIFHGGRDYAADLSL